MEVAVLGVRIPQMFCYAGNGMDVAVLGVMIPIIAIIGVVYMVSYLRKYENIERMAMIEKGVDPALFAKKSRNTSTALRASLLLIGAGTGLLLGSILDNVFHLEEVAYFSMVLIWGGIGLGAAYLVEEKKIKEEKRDQRLNS